MFNPVNHLGTRERITPERFLSCHYEGRRVRSGKEAYKGMRSGDDLARLPWKKSERKSPGRASRNAENRGERATAHDDHQEK